MSRTVIGFVEYPDLHPPLLEWLKANDLEPKHIPAQATAVIENGQITVEKFVFGPDGYRKIEYIEGEPHSVSEIVTVPLISSPAAHNLFF